MPTETHPIDARPSLWLIATFLLVIGLGVLGLGVHPRNGSMEGTSPAATEAVADFGD